MLTATSSAVSTISDRRDSGLTRGDRRIMAKAQRRGLKEWARADGLLPKPGKTVTLKHSKRSYRVAADGSLRRIGPK